MTNKLYLAATNKLECIPTLERRPPDTSDREQAILILHLLHSRVNSGVARRLFELVKSPYSGAGDILGEIKKEQPGTLIGELKELISKYQ